MIISPCIGFIINGCEPPEEVKSHRDQSIDGEVTRGGKGAWSNKQILSHFEGEGKDERTRRGP